MQCRASECGRADRSARPRLTYERETGAILLWACLLACVLACGSEESEPGADSLSDITRESPFIPQSNLRPVRGLALEDHTGQPFDERNFAGHFSLLFVGYASCPDFCPMALGSLGKVLSDPANAAISEGVRAYFLSVDPERDSLENLGPYVAHFHPEMMGLTGSREAIDHAVDALGAAYRFSEDRLLVDHSSYIYLIDPEGNVAGYLPGQMEAERLASGLELARASWRPRVEFTHAWIRKGPLGAVAAGYGTLVNQTHELLELETVSSPSYKRVMVHRTTNEAGMAGMEPVTGIRLPGGGKVPFVEGGLHLMLTGPAPGTEDADWTVLRFRFVDGVDVLSRVRLEAVATGGDGASS